MSVQYATASELASYLEMDLDTSTATLALQTASMLFSVRANTMFAPTTVTYQAVGQGSWQLYLPFRPVTAVSAVRIAGAVITDYSRIKNVLYRTQGFGVRGRYPPDLLEVDLTYGLSVASDDVKLAVLETAGAMYSHPDVTAKSESIDDYSVSLAANAGGMALSKGAMDLADLYRGTMMA